MDQKLGPEPSFTAIYGPTLTILASEGTPASLIKKSM